jgi:hypothetical protein
MPIDLIKVPPHSWEAYVSVLKECDRRQRDWGFPIFEDIGEQKNAG